MQKIKREWKTIALTVTEEQYRMLEQYAKEYLFDSIEQLIRIKVIPEFLEEMQQRNHERWMQDIQQNILIGLDAAAQEKKVSVAKLIYKMLTETE